MNVQKVLEDFCSKTGGWETFVSMDLNKHECVQERWKVKSLDDGREISVIHWSMTSHLNGTKLQDRYEVAVVFPDNRDVQPIGFPNDEENLLMYIEIAASLRKPSESLPDFTI